MKIGFDASDLRTNRADGTTRFTKELVKRLPPEHDWHLFGPCVSPAETGWISGGAGWRGSPWPLYWTQSRLPIDLWKVRPDVLFMPIQQLPILRPWGMKTVAVVHDLAFHYFPEQYRWKDWALLHAFTAQAVREADTIIAVSQATADDIAKEYGRRDGVEVVHHGLDHEQFQVLEGADKEVAHERLAATYPKVVKPFLLYVGQIQPRKNLERLVEAFEMMRGRGHDVQLVIGGGHGWLREGIEKKIQQSKYAEDILMLGRVEDDVLPILYNQAEVLVLPALYEGFGMPILEAMACGAPVVTSNVSSMPEVAGEAAVLIDPKSVRSLAEGIAAARERRESLVAKGLKRAQEFTWEKTAEKTISIITS